MTTENVAILFTDVVGSTELSQRLSPETADEVRRNHFSILRQAIAEAGGTEVKNLGDGLMVVFASASAALACGVVMQPDSRALFVRVISLLGAAFPDGSATPWVVFELP